jgi:hypothetical protein
LVSVTHLCIGQSWCCDECTSVPRRVETSGRMGDTVDSFPGATRGRPRPGGEPSFGRRVIDSYIHHAPKLSTESLFFLSLLKVDFLTWARLDDQLPCKPLPPSTPPREPGTRPSFVHVRTRSRAFSDNRAPSGHITWPTPPPQSTLTPSLSDSHHPRTRTALPVTRPDCSLVPS